MTPPNPPDFSSKEYWDGRFEKETSFEWLIPSSSLVALFSKVLGDCSRPSDSDPDYRGDSTFNVLHFGCGTSDLGSQIQSRFDRFFEDTTAGRETISDSDEDGETNKTTFRGWTGIRVTDCDYVDLNHRHEQRIANFTQMDILDMTALTKHSPEGGWDLLIDKSTADAISCGPDIKGRPPIETLCRNLAEATRNGGRWICVSYSENRFDHLQSKDRDLKEGEGATWKLRARFPLSVSQTERVVKDGDVERVVHEPETSVWGYHLERI